MKSQGKQSGWTLELIKLGYVEPLYAPSPAVQVALAAITEPEIHKFVQSKDHEALEDKDEEGEHAPTLLATLDLSHWTAIMAAALEDKEKGLTRLKQAHAVLSIVLDRDEQEIEEALRNIKTVEVALRAANPHEKWPTTDPKIAPTTSLDGSSPSTAIHPLLAKLNIAKAHKAAIEDLSESIL
jgi:hypothetical protein